jgi:hypothetical protein
MDSRLRGNDIANRAARARVPKSVCLKGYDITFSSRFQHSFTRLTMMESGIESDIFCPNVFAIGIGSE